MLILFFVRTCEPYHGFVILSTVSRETFVQIIKPSMEFKHSPNYEAFLQYKVDVGGIHQLFRKSIHVIFLIRYLWNMVYIKK
jgi:hypothetical protein